ncbi:MAG: hypothetical protein PHT62_05350 [Desulfotomaculaceae bacterium]|nr:hypothetical protein [Desulfotomaculaceae bacterium]
MPKGDKYVALKSCLKKSNQPIIKLTFEQIKKIIGDSLPVSLKFETLNLETP